MISRFTGKILKTNHTLIPELLHFLDNLKFQPYVSTTPAALACSSIDNTARLYVFLFSYSVYIEIQVYSKSKFIARSTRSGNQKRDLPFRLIAPEIILCV